MQATASAPADQAPDIAILSPCGWGNLGDSAIVESVVQAIRRRQPAARMAGFTLNPADTAARHGIPAFTCTGFALEHYGVMEQVPFARPGEGAKLTDPLLERAAEPGHQGSSGVRALVRSVPGLLPARELGRAIRKDARHRSWLRPHLARVRTVVVAGGGQLDDFWGGAFGHPYVLWRWARFARATAARYLVLSVGTGSLKQPLARSFVLRALRLASYRSFRDEGSRALIRDPLVQSDAVVPDLAYGLPLGEDLRRPGQGARPLIALSPIAHCDPRSWPVADAARYRSYVERMIEVAAGFLAEGNDLLLYGTDMPDWDTAKDIVAGLSARGIPELDRRVSLVALRSHGDLLTTLASARLVVCSRLHGAILAHLVKTPVLAISYERKVTTLMDLMEHQPYCLGIDDFQPAVVLEVARRMLLTHTELAREIDARVGAFRARVETQYDSIFGQAP